MRRIRAARGAIAPAASCAVLAQLAAASLLAAQPAAELSATLDAAAAAVHYDGYLASGAVSVTPAVQLDAPLATVTARGTYLLFQSGNHSLQGLVAASAFTPAVGGALRGELAATAGASSYDQADAPATRYGHALARGRLHVMGDNRGAYAGLSLGRSVGAGQRSATAYGVGGWRRFRWVAVDLSVTATRVGELRYADAEGAVRWSRRHLDVDLNGGARAWSRGGGRGAYGEAIATYWLSPQFAVVASGGRYPTDPTRGSIAGRYAALAFRVARRVTQPPAASLAYLRPYRFSGRGRDRAGVRLPGVEVAAAPNGARTIRIRVPGATAVELMSDFTDWHEVPLTRADGDVWELTVPLAPGTYRFNVRADGGAWVVPPGVTAFADDFGGIVAMLVVK